MTGIELFSYIFFFSACLLGLYGLYITIRVRFFIVKRYEEETNLSQTRYFREMMPWVQHFPPFLRSPIYLAHLLKFRWLGKGNRFDRKRKDSKGDIIYYNDIESPKQVTSHFSEKEIKQVRRAAYTISFFILYIVAFNIFKLIWPETFTSG
jgi:hypothetical protein